jgi:hypothetical protein
MSVAFLAAESGINGPSDEPEAGKAQGRLTVSQKRFVIVTGIS